MIPYKFTRRQAGVSLISLLIASALGIFLVGGIGKIYIDSKNAFNARSAFAVVAENSRFALHDLRRYLVLAANGIGENTDSDYTLPDNYLRTFPALEPENSVASATTGIINQDSNGNSVVAVRYSEGPAPCGEGGRINTMHTVRYYRNDAGVLLCQSIETVGGALDIANMYERELLSGVFAMRVLYGVDTDIGNEDKIANQYLTATEVDDAGLWMSVVSIRVGLVISSDTAELPYSYQPADAEQMGLLGMDVEAPDTAHAFKVASATIVLRNLNSISMDKQ